jgi:antitoxin PrlF
LQSMEQKARITSKGQVTIPKAVREALGIKERDSLLFELEGDEVRVHAAGRPVSFADYAGAWCEGMSWDEVNDYVTDLRGHDDE